MVLFPFIYANWVKLIKGAKMANTDKKWGTVFGAPRPQGTRGGHDPIFYPRTGPNGLKLTHFMF
jgi:hypothetical protein